MVCFIKLSVFAFVTAMFFGGAYYTPSTTYDFSSVLAENDNVVDYQVREGKFAVIVVRENGMSKDQARKIALQRAAQITTERGSRYFQVDAESETSVIQSGSDANPFYGNMYQELIIEKDFGKQEIERKNNAKTQTIPALRVVFSIVPEKSGLKTLDACDYSECSG